MSRFKDLTGKKFHRLTVIKFDKTIDRRSYWVFKCDCGIEKSLVGTHVSNGKTKSCGCLKIERSKESIKKIQGWHKKSFGEAAKNRLLRTYKRGARLRNLKWNLTNEETIDLFQKNCYHCGDIPKNYIKDPLGNGEFIYNGIDRLDNNKGYIKENCVSSCKICNRAKSDLTLNEFNEWVKRIAYVKS